MTVSGPVLRKELAFQDELIQAEEILEPENSVPKWVPATGEDPEIAEKREQEEAWQKLTPAERQIVIWKSEIRTFKSKDRRTRYQVGKRLAAIQAERAKAHVGTFTTVDLKELKIGIPAAYAFIKFYKRIESKAEAYLLQIAKDEKRFPVETVDAFDQARADAKIVALNHVIDEEAQRISELRKTKNAQPLDYQLKVLCSSHKQRERFKAKWLALDEKVRAKAVIQAVLRAKNPS
jgi:hypothetical protein